MSVAETLQTDNPDVALVEPNIERDAPLSVGWLEGKLGRATLASMGVADKDNKPTTPEEERERIKDFIERQDQYNWMIEYQGRVVGSVWVDLQQVDTVPAPAVHIMIGDPDTRGKGIGRAAIGRAIEYLESLGSKSIYSRHLTKNNGASGLLQSLGFADLDSPYTDDGGLEWQNVVRTDRPEQ
jgi:RimJ/RimL family protein N-acetyltransferase